jgi:hypothetical protein
VATDATCIAAAANTTATARGVPNRDGRGLTRPITTPTNTMTTSTRSDPST